MATTKASTETSRDFYSGMPDWQREQLIGDAAFESEYRDTMANIASRAANKGRDIVGMSDRERAGLSTQTGATKNLAKGMGKTIAGLNGVGVDSDLGDIRDPRAMGSVTGPGSWQMQDFADIDSIRSGYESGYTDDVVDTTLAGMTREAQRAQLERDARAASVGGLSNSRSAVADAVAGQLTGMNMAEMEAKLRDQAFNNAAQFGLEEAGMRNDFNLGQEKARSDYALGAADFRLDRAKAQAQNQLDLAGFDLEEAIAQAQQGNTAAQFALDKAGLKQSMLGDIYDARTDKAGALTEYGSTARELRQQRKDANYYGPMEAGSWLADVYSGSRTRDSAPYSFTENSESTGDNGEKEPSKWQGIAAGAVAGLGGFL